MKTKLFVILLLIALPLCLFATDNTPTLTRDAALLKLMEGNARYADGHPAAWSANPEKRMALTTGQHPVACIVTCSDSRVPPEILFDQTLGDVFVIRNAGNVPSAETIGSVEYAVEHLNVPVVIVMGHTHCGAVSAACSETKAQGALGKVMGWIAPAVTAAKQSGLTGDALCNKAVEINERMTAMQIMEGSPVISEAVAKRSTSLMTATYSMETGRVDFQTELAAVTLPKMTVPPTTPPAEPQAKATTPATETKTVADAPKPATEAKPAVAKTEPPAAPKKTDTSSSYARRHR